MTYLVYFRIEHHDCETRSFDYILQEAGNATASDFASTWEWLGIYNLRNHKGSWERVMGMRGRAGVGSSIVEDSLHTMHAELSVVGAASLERQTVRSTFEETSETLSLGRILLGLCRAARDGLAASRRLSLNSSGLITKQGWR
jgi:hypothetical protein